MVELLTVNQAASLLEQRYPDVWKRVYTKQYDAPGNYHSFKAPAVTMTAACIEERRRARAGVEMACTNVAMAAAELERYDFPTYYVGKSLFETLRHMHPPRKMKWSELTFGGFSGMIFMLPTGALLQQDTGRSVVFVAATKIPGARRPCSILPEIEYAERPDDTVVIFWSSGSCMLIEDFTVVVDSPLEPDPNWIRSQSSKEVLALAPPEFTSYICALTANLLLAQEVMPELIEPGERTNRRVPSSGVAIHRPTFLGRKYETVRRTRKHIPTSSYFSKEGWRSGCWRRVHYGVAGKEVKIRIIPAYIAMSKELVRPAENETPMTVPLKSKEKS